jgi:alpha-beta hydrolase superfamily lysophospholipase
VGIPGDFGDPGFGGLVDDVAAYGAAIRRDGLPLFLVAHSMGSFAAQGVLLEHSDQYAGVVLSGTTALDVLGQALAAQADDGPAGLEAFNAGFEHRTGYEWLSRDDAEVDLYVADPLCGFEVPEEDIPQMFALGERYADPTTLAQIRDDLPVLIASGEQDPLSGGGELVQVLAQRYRDAGLTDVSVTVYPGARHEILNETNRDEVTSDLVRWISERA